MLARIGVFAATHTQYFAKDSPAGQLLDEIEGAIGKLSACKTSQTSAREDRKLSTVDRAAARTELRRQLDAISRTARALNLGQFWVPGDKSDRALAEIGQIFATRAEPLKQTFIEGHLLPDFLDSLKAAVQNLEKTMAEQVSRAGVRIAATSGIEQTRNDAMSAVDRLDALMQNVLRDDAPALAVWRSARRVERYARPRRAELASAPAAPSIPPISGTAAPAAHP